MHGCLAPGSKTLADELAALRGVCPRALAPDVAWASVVDAARVVPAVAVRYSGYEFHLGAGPARIDVSAGVVPDGPLATHLLAAGDRGPASGRLADVVRALATPGGALNGCRLAILEYDSHVLRSSSACAAGGSGSPAPPLPGVFLTFPRWPVDRHDALVKLLAGDFPALMGLTELTGLAPRLSSLLNGLPQGAFLSNAGLFPARSTSALRVVVAGVRLVDVRLLLQRLDALQALDSVLGVLGQVDDVCGVRCGISLDLSAGAVGSRLGVELHSAGLRNWTSAPRSAWRPLLDRLAERGLCTAGQAGGLMDWIGTERLFSDRRAYWLLRGLNHVKVSVGVGDPAAKAYAGLAIFPAGRPGRAVTTSSASTSS